MRIEIRDGSTPGKRLIHDGYRAYSVTMECAAEIERLQSLAALAVEIAARLKMHRVGSLTPDPCPLITQFENDGDWLSRYDALTEGTP